MALIPVDSAGIRKRAAAALRRARTAYGKAEKEWAFFIDQEAPAFARWLHLECGPFYARIRQAREKLEYYLHLLHLMEREFFLTRAPHRICYERAKERLENPCDDEGPDWSWDETRDEGAFEDVDPDAFDEPPEADEPFEEPTPWPDVPTPPAEGKQLKALYRQLSLRLHPDANGDVSLEQRELWFQVQDAYARGDLERLELLLIHADLAEGRVSAHSPVSSLLELTEQIRQALKTLRGAIRKARKDPAWGFLSWEPRRKASLIGEAKTELRAEAEHWENRLAYVVEEVESWHNAPVVTTPSPQLTDEEAWAEELLQSHPRPTRRTRRSRPHPDQMDFGFF